MNDWDDPILSKLTDEDFEFPNLDEEEDDYDDDHNTKAGEIGGKEEEEEGEVNDTIPDEGAFSSGTSKSSREVLVTLDNERKKLVILQEGDFDKIEQKLVENLEDDPVFKKLIRKSQIVFQEYNAKFNTWVDFDKSRDVSDGTQLKAVFVPKAKEESTSRHKHRHKEKKSKRRSEHYSRSSSKHRSQKRLKSDFDDFQTYSSTDADEKYSDSVCSSSEPNLTVYSKYGEGSIYGEPSLTSYSDEEPSSTTTATDGNLPRFTASEGQLYFLSLALQSKNPITALHELCQKLKCGSPLFSSVSEGEDKDGYPCFLMKVTIGSESFVPDVPSKRKKLAKTAAAECALKTIGLLK